MIANSHVLLVGCGALGTRLGLQLLREGQRVTALRRNPEGLPAGFASVAVDLSIAAPPALPDIDAMVITLPPISLANGGNGAIAALDHLNSALPALPRRTILVSSTRVFDGVTHTRPLTEADAPQAATARAKSLLATEHRAVEHFGAIILRPAGIYGPGRDMLVKAVHSGRAMNHSRLTNRIHETDLVRTLAALLESSSPPAVLHAVDQLPAPLGDVLAGIAGRVGLPLPPDAGGDVEGRVFDGSALLALLGSLTFPGHAEGYAHLGPEAGG